MERWDKNRHGKRTKSYLKEEKKKEEEEEEDKMSEEERLWKNWVMLIEVHVCVWDNVKENMQPRFLHEMVQQIE